MARLAGGWILALAAACGDVEPPKAAAGLAWGRDFERGELLAAAFDPAGETVASAASNDRLRLHGLDPKAGGAILAEARGHRRGITGLAFDPAGWQLATIGPDRTVRLWSRDPLEELFALEGMERPPIEVAWSADGLRVAAVTMAGAVHVWDAASGEALVARDGPAQRGVMALALSSDGERLAWAGDGGRLRVWSTSTGERLAAGRIDALGFVAAVALEDDGARMAVGARDEAWLVVHDLEGGGTVTCSGLGAPPRALAFDRAGRRLACATADGAIALLDVRSGRRMIELEPGDAVSGAPPRRLAFDAAGARLAAARPGPRLRVWDVAAAQPLERGTPIAGPPPTGTLPVLPVEEGMLDLARLAVPGYDPPELRAADAGAFALEDFPAAVRDLAGETVMVLGYPLAAELEDGETRAFLLSRFPPGCCFGAVPVLDEWIEVRAPEDTPPLPSDVPVLVEGTLEVGELLDPEGFALSLYRMTAIRVEMR